MSELSGQNQALDHSSMMLDNSLMDEQEMVDYLRQHPDFFTRYPELVEILQIPHQQKGSISLVELQSEQLRKKLRQLSSKLTRLIHIAKQNEAIYRVYADLNLRLIKAKDFAELENTLEQALLNELKLSAMTLKPFKGPHALPEIQQKLFKEKRFKDSTFFFGRLSQHEKQLLFPDTIAESVVLVLLQDGKEQGLLAVGSKDPGHFRPDMDTLLLSQLQQVLSVLLPKLLHY